MNKHKIIQEYIRERNRKAGKVKTVKKTKSSRKNAEKARLALLRKRKLQGK